LWSGSIITFLPGFVTSFPTIHFQIVAEKAESSTLAPIFHLVTKHAILAKSQVESEITNLKPLDKRIIKVIALASGTPDSYVVLEKLPSSCLPMATQLLTNTQILNIASVEFIWRVYEHCLDMGASPEHPLYDPKSVIHFFEHRASQLDSADLLLGECLLHRLQNLILLVKNDSSPSLLTDQSEILQLLTTIGSSLIDKEENFDKSIPSVLESQIAFSLFSAALSPLWKPIEGQFAQHLNTIFEKRAEELLSVRQNCLDEAKMILASHHDDDAIIHAFSTSIKKMEEEIGAITDLNRQSVRMVLHRLTEDPKMWLCISTMLGSALGSLPAIAPAAAAVTAFSLLGATALKETRARKEKLRNSKWSLIYYLQN